MNKFDLIVIGAGPGGYETAAHAAAEGLKVLIIERDHPGGTCLNRGCIPTKALCHSAEQLHLIATASQSGITLPSGDVAVDMAKVIERKDGIVAELREGVMTLLSATTYLHGEARFTAPDTVMVDDTAYTAPQIIIATGSRPAILPIPGAELAIDSDRLLQATTLPESIVIIGGGVIGMEFASILNAFGVKVTVVEYCKEILPPIDAEVAKRLRMSLKRRGINIITSAAVTAIEPGMTVHYTAKNRQQTVAAEQVLMAVGRRPVLPEGLEAAGVKLNGRGFIEVDATMRTTSPGIYAIGDVNGLCMLAHAASAQGEVALGLDTNLSVIPSAVFTMPECAAVGLTEEQCLERNLDFTIGRATFRANGKAMAMSEPDGLVKVIVERTTSKILGCHICGAHASDLIQEATLAMAAHIPATTLAGTIYPHPTLSEVMAAAIRQAVSNG